MKEKDIDKKDGREKEDVLRKKTDQGEEQLIEEGKDTFEEQESKIIYFHDRKNKEKNSERSEEEELEKEDTAKDEKNLEEEVKAEAEDKDGSSDEAEKKEEDEGKDSTREIPKRARVVKLRSNSWKDTLLNKLGEVEGALPSNGKELMIFGSALLILVIILFASRGIWKTGHNGGEIEKYTVGKFVMEVNQASQQEEAPFPRGKRIQLYGPIIRMNEATVYMKSEDKLVEIQLSSKTRRNTDFSKFILGKSYKLETTVVDAGGADDVLYLNEGEFVLEELPQEEKVEEKQ